MSERVKKILITAGPTHEPVDKVRYLANRSSGRVGLALAKAGSEAGAAVTLLLGPIDGEVDLPGAPGVRVLRYVSAADLEKLLAMEFPKHDALIMAAAVADYRPVPAATDKIERTGGRMMLELEPVPDLVAGVATCKRADQMIVAFALEKPDVMLERATAKMKRKGVDAIVANPLKTMGADEIEATLITPDGERLTPAGAGVAVAKGAFAGWLMAWVLKK